MGSFGVFLGIIRAFVAGLRGKSNFILGSRSPFLLSISLPALFDFGLLHVGRL